MREPSGLIGIAGGEVKAHGGKIVTMCLGKFVEQPAIGLHSAPDRLQPKFGIQAGNGRQ